MDSMDEVKKYDPNRFKMPPTEIWQKLRLLAADVGYNLGCRDPLTPEFIAVMLVGIKVFDRKQRGYGPGNIAKFGDYGTLVRANDKVERLRTLYEKGKDPSDEGRDDSFGDNGVYSFIGIMCRWDLWPGFTPAKARDKVDVENVARELNAQTRETHRLARENERLREVVTKSETRNEELFKTVKAMQKDLEQARLDLIAAKEALGGVKS